ncbi:hypothetical protein BDK51DRAFT_33091 [Blyttiomyces helicus]|uniref:Uncharacterized protein n=1 Tax=Blyttiomyces helicus TaxID=388810 RepID=A0A4P9WMF2_9FUNG|nr:hypothetical protein BDK51DRAFT_33091 [Blyttiomyces helicus]|eukprot:RKO93662.1 hypothetical protein BDK51DRAFT_33091 [Blyttiomyces helicus]
MVVVYAFIFPVGFLLARKKSTWHPPVQGVGTVLALIGYVLGHRQKNHFDPNNHHSQVTPAYRSGSGVNEATGQFTMAKWGDFGSFGFNWRLPTNPACFMWIATLGECAGHYLMGSAFIFYGAVYVLRQFGSRQSRWPMAVFDSVMVLFWGTFNVTELAWGRRWNHADMQHVSYGVMWMFGGGDCLLLYVFRPYRKRAHNPVSGLILAFTGIIMSNHAQPSPFSIKLHVSFGSLLMLGGCLRIVSLYIGGGLDLILGFFLILCGTLNMGGIWDAVGWAEASHIDPVSYCTVLAAIAFMILLNILGMLVIAKHGVPGAWDRDYEDATLPTVGLTTAGYASLADPRICTDGRFMPSRRPT